MKWFHEIQPIVLIVGCYWEIEICVIKKISHLSWASLFLGFHTLGLYVHNDVMLAFGTPEKQILIEPVFAQWIQSAHGKTSYGFDVLLSSMDSPALNAGRSIWLSS